MRSLRPRGPPNSAMFEEFETAIPGFYKLQPTVREDHRGRFVKTVHRSSFSAHGLRADFAEQYYSVSIRNVLRGLHFQRPPWDHAKLVYCVSGAVFDVAVDLRAGSPTYGHSASVELTAEGAELAYLVAGLAHGFYTVSETATLVYNVTSEYAPGYDAGIHWASAGISWPAEEPIVSERDSHLPALADFETPFVYGGQ